MTVVRRAETDMFRLAPIAEVMVNPVNTAGAMGRGLALEFKNRHPDMYERYRRVCEDGKLKVGKIHVVRDPAVNYIIVNLPTKRHFADASDPADIRRGLDELRHYLKLPQNSLFNVVMPMLGTGEGKLGYEAIEPAFFEYLDDLDNIIHLCMHPDRMDHIPRYLSIIGPRVYGAKYLKQENHQEPVLNPHYEAECAQIEEGVFQALHSWGSTYADYDAVVSGGADGVDTVACGTDRADPSYQDSLARKYSPHPPIICKADWKRLGKAAGYKRNGTVIDIATDIVAFRPPGIASVGTTMAIKLARKAIEHALAKGLLPKRVYIVGEQDLEVGAKTYIRI